MNFEKYFFSTEPKTLSPLYRITLIMLVINCVYCYQSSADHRSADVSTDVCYTQNVTEVKINKTVLKYYIYKYSKFFSYQQIYREIFNAFKSWSDVSNVQFNFDNNKPDIEISFENFRNHRVSDLTAKDIDFENGDLAHASFGNTATPSFIHILDTINYSVYDNLNIHYPRMQQIVAHEIGHVLGLSHDNNPKSIMYSCLTSFENVKLSDEDKFRIQKLYGKINEPKH